MRKEGMEMSWQNDFHFKLYAEDRIRARLNEAENYRMLNRLRKEKNGWILRFTRDQIVNFGRLLIRLGERLERFDFSSVTS